MACIPSRSKQDRPTIRKQPRSWRNVIFRALRVLCGTYEDTDGIKPVYLEKDSTDYDVSEASKSSHVPSTILISPENSYYETIETNTKTQKALVVARKGEYEIRGDFPMPRLELDNEVMIKTVAVGLNQIDWKTVDYNFCLPDFPWVTGREMSGVVVQVGSAVKHLQPGARVWTSTYYKDIRAGCFQEYVVVPIHTVSRIPESLAFEAAACLGVAGLTACMTLWRWLGIPMNPEEPVLPKDWMLIWGGSTITGQFATQVAVHAGLKVITINSQATKKVSEKLGATYVVVRDGKTDAEIVEEIKIVTSGCITRAIDVVGPKTAALSLQTVSATEPVHFAPLAMMDKTQTIPENVIVHTVEMKQFTLDTTCEAYAQRLNALVEGNVIALPELHILEGGFTDIISGLEAQKIGNLAGKKMIVRL